MNAVSVSKKLYWLRFVVRCSLMANNELWPTPPRIKEHECTPQILESKETQQNILQSQTSNHAIAY